MRRHTIVPLTLLAGLLLAAHPGDAQARRRKPPAEKIVSALTSRGLPNVQAKAAIVVDMDSGEELYSRDPDALRSIASTTKIYVAMAVRAEKLDLDGETVITQEDADHARGGAKSRLLVGRRFRNSDLLRAMLVASDNRACTAIARAAGLSQAQLIARMNGLAHRLGLKKTHFTDPSGLRGNESTPREMVIALREAMKDPLLTEIMSTHEVDVAAVDAGEATGPGKKAKKRGAYSVHYVNTNQSLRNSPYKVLAGKTGFTDAAGYCLVVAAEIKGRKVVMAFFGDAEKLTRFGDFARVAGWIDADGPGKHTDGARAGKGIGELADAPPAIGAKVAKRPVASKP